MLCIAIALASLMGCSQIPGSTTRPALVTTTTSGAGPGDGSVADTTPIAATSPVAASSKFFGLTVLDYQNVTPQLTFGTTRTWDAHPDLDWAEANPAAAQYNFAPLNSFIDTNLSRGTQILYTFGRTPRWASTRPDAPGPYGPGQCAPPILIAWDKYVTEVVTNAAGRIKYWELWNEPDQATSYCGDISSMVAMAQHAYRIIKQIDPSATVLSPSASGAAGAAWLSFLSSRRRPAQL